jgi:hypothetical protein
MANHLTPTELGNEAGMDSSEVIAKCVELGVPIFHGRIDKSLFQVALEQADETEGAPAAWGEA